MTLALLYKYIYTQSVRIVKSIRVCECVICSGRARRDALHCVSTENNTSAKVHVDASLSLFCWLAPRDLYTLVVVGRSIARAEWKIGLLQPTIAAADCSAMIIGFFVAGSVRAASKVQGMHSPAGATPKRKRCTRFCNGNREPRRRKWAQEICKLRKGA